MTSFKDLHLNPKILTALENKGYTTPTPIQQQAIPHVIEGKDLLGIAQTGTGKTAAFSLPILHNLAKNNISVKSGSVRALILTPTRELASQITENVEAYSKELNLKHAVMYGGVSDHPQIAALQRGVDILIATPGRLMDLADKGHIRFMQVEILVLDEADRMLDMGFINDIKKIITKLPPKRQTLFFSATMPKTITDLADSILTNPVRVEITPQSTAVDRITQKINFVDRRDKPALLKRILKQPDVTSVLVFSKTKYGADDVTEFLQRSGFQVAAIHGNKTQDAREKALNNFREGKIRILVATDVAARGIDIPDISYVINYDIPTDPESYVHRIGRTARAGKKGVAISFCDPVEVKLLDAVEKAINFKIPVDDSHPFHHKSSGAPMAKHEEAPRSRTSHKPHEKKPSNSHSKPSSHHSKPADRHDSKPKAPTHSHKPHAPKKKSVGIFGFVTNLFKSKKPVAKVAHKVEPKVEAPVVHREKPRPKPRERSDVNKPKIVSDFKGRKLSSGKKDS